MSRPKTSWASLALISPSPLSVHRVSLTSRVRAFLWDEGWLAPVNLMSLVSMWASMTSESEMLSEVLMTTNHW